MKYFFAGLAAAFTISTAAHAAIVERRIWIETAIDTIKEDMCQDKMKVWRCLWSDRAACIKVMKETFPTCSGTVIPDLPEYIDSDETKAAAFKVVTDCMSAELGRKYVLPLPKEKMDEYNICTGTVARSKPLNPNLQKALDASKDIMKAHCNNGSFYRKCYSMPENSCREMLDKESLACTMKMEADGVSVKPEPEAIKETATTITNCTNAAMRKNLDSTHHKIKDKDCE
jgi:hypothetical protein